MSYTHADAAAFERLLEVLREAPRYRLAEYLARGHLHRKLAEVGVTPDIHCVASLMRTPRWREWLRDYEQVRGALLVRQAVDEHLAVEVARAMAADFRAAVRAGTDVPEAQGKALARVVSTVADAPAGGLLDVPSATDRTLLTGSLENDNSAVPQTVMPEPPPPPPRSARDDLEWSEVRQGGPDDDR